MNPSVSLDARRHQFESYNADGELLGRFSSAEGAASHVLVWEKTHRGKTRGGWVSFHGIVYKGREMRELAAPPQPRIEANA